MQLAASDSVDHISWATHLQLERLHKVCDAHVQVRAHAIRLPDAKVLLERLQELLRELPKVLGKQQHRAGDDTVSEGFT